VSARVLCQRRGFAAVEVLIQVSHSWPSTGRGADCKSGAMSALDCGKAVAVGDSYDRCLSEVASATCAAWTANPLLMSASCRQVINSPTRDGCWQPSNGHIVSALRRTRIKTVNATR
jgi:hypothetical protein